MSYANPYAVSQNPTPGDGPISNPSAWDYITLAGVRSPGVIPRGGVKFKRKFKWDKKEGKGTDGATPTFVGKPCAEGTIKFQFWCDSQFAAWDLFVALFDYNPIKKQSTTGLGVDHPELRRLKIKSIIVEEIGTIEDVGDGKWEVEISAFEFRQPPQQSSVSTPTKSADGTATGDGDPNNPFNDPVYAAAIAQRIREAKAVRLFRNFTRP